MIACINILYHNKNTVKTKAFFCHLSTKEDKMIVDVHTHIFPDSIRSDRSAYFPGEPAFELLYASPKSKMAGAADLIRSMDEHEVDVSIVFGFPWTRMETCKMNNDYVMEAVARYPDRLRGLSCVSVGAPTAAAEVERCIAGGLSGAGELAFYQSGITAAAISQLAPVMAICKEKGLPVLIHTNEPVGHRYPGKTDNTLFQIYDMVCTFPENKIILAHWGGGLFFYALLKREVKEKLVNVWFDTAASPFLYEPDIYRISTDLAGEDKILMGTDYPLLSPARYYKEIHAAGIPEDVSKRMMGENAAALFGLSGRS